VRALRIAALLVPLVLAACASSERGDAGDVGGAMSGCSSDAYTEPLPSNASLADLAYSPSQPDTYLLAALARRYPLGKAIVDGARQGGGGGDDCVTAFLQDRTDPSSVLRDASTVVHECGHVLDLNAANNGDGTTSVYMIRTDLRFQCAGGDTVARGGKTFERSRIVGDAFGAKRPPCGHDDVDGCDVYAESYLDGSPDDAKFQSGDQGYDLLLEEAVQYVNSLASALTFEQAYAENQMGERDGILTLLWYVERYLALARTKHPDSYEVLSKDPCWRQATLTVWDRAWFYLQATSGKTALGIDDGPIEALVRDPILIAEIDALRALECR
jgi:hypothetical protein